MAHQQPGMHYLHKFRKTVKKVKPQYNRPPRPLDLEEHLRVEAAPGQPSGRSRGRLLQARVAAVVPAARMPEQLEDWAERLHCKTVACICVPLLAIAAVVATAVTIALSAEVEESPCDDDCMKYSKWFTETISWSHDACDDFYEFVCGKYPHNQTTVRNLLNHEVVKKILHAAR
ncbi:uncharacterized protein LOC144165243 [Haemaphysalis longicornis]